VVGTSYYEHLPPFGPAKLDLPQLDCAALAGARFATWLVGMRNILSPIGTIRVLLSPSESEKSAPGYEPFAGVPPAVGDNVSDALAELEIDCSESPGSIAILYFAGHGILAAPDSLFVLLQDAFRHDDLHNAFNLAATQQALAFCNLAASAIFADACQQIPPDTTWDLGSGRGLRPKRTAAPDSRRDGCPIFYAATTGESAFGEAGVGTYFVDALLDCLTGRAAKRSPSGGWHVTVQSLAAELPNAVADRADSQEAIPAGKHRDFAIHEFDKPPIMPMLIRCTPASFRTISTGTLTDKAGSSAPVAGLRFHEDVAKLSLPVGRYKLRLVSDPPPRFNDQTHHLTHFPPRGLDEDVEIE
jgi:hypothetical protein